MARKKDISLSSLIVYIGLQVMFFMMLAALLKMYSQETGIDDFWASAEDYLPLGILILGILILVRMLIGAAKSVIRRLNYKTPAAEENTMTLFQFVSYAVWGIVIVTITVLVVGDAENIALGIGLLSAAIAFALQVPLLNLAGWIYIVVSRPYKVGDRVEIGGTRGVVTHITPMHTQLYEFKGWLSSDNFTGRVVSVPNSAVLTRESFNYTFENDFVWEQVVVSITYESDHERAKAIILNAARRVLEPSLRLDPAELTKKLELRNVINSVILEPTVFMEFEPSSVNMTLVFVTPAQARWSTKSSLVEEILREIRKEPLVSLAYPHVEVVGGKSW